MNYKSIFVIILTASLFSCKHKAVNLIQKEKIIPVKVAKVTKETVFFPIRSSGRLTVKSEQKLSFRTGGIINHIYVRGGQTVREGQMLAELNLSEIKAQVNIASDAYEKANRDFMRAENLYNDSVATLEVLQNAKTAREIAKSNLVVAKFNLKHSKITAPSNGKILKVLMEENEITSPGYPVILFGSTSEKWIVRTHVSDKDMISIQIGDSVDISLDPYPNFVFKGKVSEIAGMADPYTGTYEIEISMLNTLNKQMATGFIARTEIIPHEKSDFLAIPTDALFNITEKTGSVYVAKDSTVSMHKIHILHISDSIMYVSGKLQPGEFVITDGINYIDENSKIKIENQIQ